MDGTVCLSLTAFSIWRGFCMPGRKFLDPTTYQKKETISLQKRDTNKNTQKEQRTGKSEWIKNKANNLDIHGINDKKVHT